MLDKIARARAKARAHVWKLIEDAPAGFPWLEIAGKTLTGWVVIDVDATLVTASSDKEGAAPTWKKGYGFHPLGAWLANTRECLAMLLRPGNAGSNTFTGHKEVLAAALRQVPARFRRKILVRGRRGRRQPRAHRSSAVDVLRAPDRAVHLRVDDHRRRRGRHPAGPRGRVEARHLPGRHDRGRQGRRGDHGPDEPRRELAGRPAVDRPPGEAVPPAPEKPDGLREKDRLEVLDYLHERPRQRDRRRPGHPPPAVHRHPAPRARRRGDRRRPHRQGHGPAEPAIENLAGQLHWVIAANIAADLTAWTRLLGLHDDADLKDADPDTLRYRIWHIPARLAHHARQRILKISPGWPWKEAFLTCWQRLSALPAPT
jgi:hypothetical protein